MYVSTFVILSPADYQSILAELQSPAALRSEPHFLEPELPVTPNISPAHHQHHVYPETTTPVPATSHPHPLPSCPVPVLDPDSSVPRSPPRPCQLTLPAPAFELPEPTAAAKVRKPHIALNDELLLSEEEDRSYQEMVPCRKARSPSLPTMCELEVEMAYSTSSPTLSSVSSVTPSSPEGGAQIESPNGVQEDVGFVEGRQEVAVDLEVVQMVAAELAQGNGLVDWVEQNLIENVERKCELITKDGCKLSGGSGTFAGQEGAQKENGDKPPVLSQDGTDVTSGEVQEVRDGQGQSGEQHDAVGIEEGEMMEDEETAREGYDESFKVQTLQEGSEEGNPGSDRADDELQSKDEEGMSPGSHRDTRGTAERGEVAEDQVGSALSPQAWVEALRECHDTDSESSQEVEEEEEEDEKVKGEPSKSLTEEMETKEGSEEEEEDGEKAQAAVEEMRGQAEQTEKDLCSLVGWHSDSSSVNVEPPTPGRSVSSDLLDRRER